MIIQLPQGIATNPQFYKTLLKEKERRDASKNLHAFTMAAWHVIEPGTPYIDGWHLQAISEHLQAVSNLDIRNLLINIPPRHMKSIQVAVMWPVFTWIDDPSFRWLFSSYAGSLSVRDSLKCRRLIESPWFQDMWGDRFELIGDQNTKTFFENDHSGYRFATSVGASTTGHGGDCIVCFPHWQQVHTTKGLMSIGDLVENKVRVNVPSYNAETNTMELRQVTGWHKNPGRDIVRVTLSDGTHFDCTPDHRILTNTGWVEAKDTMNMLVARTSNEVLSGMLPATTTSDSVDHRHLDAILAGNNFSRTRINKDSASFIVIKNSARFARARISQLRSTISNVLSTTTIGQVIQRKVQRITVKVANIRTRWTLADERQCQQGMQFAVESFTFTPQHDSRIAVTQPVIEQLIRSFRKYATKARNIVSRKVDDRQPHFVSVRSVSFLQGEEFTYCLSVEHNRSFVVGNGVIVSNCDDPHNALEAQSDVMRESTLEWWDQAMSTRLNNPKTGTKVIVMQRLHEKDLSGHVLAKKGWEHLCLPAEYERGRKLSVTTLGFKDPRKEDGELLWPERFGRQEIESLKADLGQYGASGQLQQRPSPAEGGIVKRQWFKMLSADKDLPKIVYVLQSYDTAFTEKTNNDPTAAVTLGVFNTDSGRAVIVLDCWKDHLGYPELRKRMYDEYKTSYGDKNKGVDTVLIEEKGSGISLIQDLRRAGIPVHSYNPGRADKVTRVHAISPLIESGIVYLPESKRNPGSTPTWLDPLINELLAFPNAEHDDMVDALTQALIYLRDSRLINIDASKFDLDRVAPSKEKINPYAA